MIGIDPGPLTLREILWMYRGKAEDAWNHTSNVVATMFNCRPGVKKSDWISAAAIHPLHRRKPKDDKPIATLKMSDAAAVFVKLPPLRSPQNAPK